MNKDDKPVTTCGVDDSKKAAGFKVYDVKTDNIILAHEDGTRKSFTTGFADNKKRMKG